MMRENRDSLVGLAICRLVVLLVCLFVSWLLPAPLGGGSISYAGQLLFDGVPVDITTAANEDLVIAPGTGGNTQIGDASGTNSNATSNDDLHITGKLETDGAAYFDSTVKLGDSTSDTITVSGYFGSHLIPSTDSTYDLGASSLAWRNLYVDTISGYNSALALNPATGYSLTGAVTKNAATGNEVAYDLDATINKATSGNYTGLKLNVTETSAPGSADKLLDLQVGGTSRVQVYNGANSANYGLLSIGRDDWDGSTAGFFAGSANGTQLAINAITGFTGNLVDAQVAGTSMFSVDNAGNVTAAGTITGAGAALSGTTSNTFEIDTDDSSTTPTLTFGANAGAVPHIQTQVGNLHIEPAGAVVINDGTIGAAYPAYATAAGELYVDNDFETTGKSYHFDDILLKNQKSLAVLDNTNPGTADYNHSIYMDQANNVLQFKEWWTFRWTNTSADPDMDIMELTPSAGLFIRNDDANNSTVLDILSIRHSTSGAPAAGIGTGLSFQVEDAGDMEEQGSIDTVLTTVTNNAENADMVFSLNRTGTIAEHTRLLSGGNVQFEGATDNAFETTFSITDPTADRTITIPDADVNLGTINTNSHAQNTDTGTSGTDFKIGNASDAAAVNLSLTFGNTNSETITFTGAGTDNFAFSDLIEAAGLTLDANTNLTLSSGTGVYSQTYTSTGTPMTLTADSMTTGSGISISADGLSTGNGIAVDSTSTAGNAYKLINLSSSGANAVAGMGRYGVYSSMTGTGTTSTNYAGYFSASGATTNYSIYATGNPTADVGNIYSENTGNDGSAGAFVATATGVGSGAKGIYVRNDGRSDVAAHIETNNTLATAQTLYITSTSTQSPDVVAIVSTGDMAGGNGLVITNTSTTNDARGMYLRNDGDGAVGAHMEINNTANASQVLYCVTNGTGYDASFIRNNTSTNSTDTAVELKHTVSTAATGGADGIGAALIFTNETSTDGTEHATAKISGVLTDADTATTTDGDLVFSYAQQNTFKEGIRLVSGGDLWLEGATDDDFEVIFDVTDPTADRTITIPNADVNLGNTHAQNTDTGTSGTDFKIGNASDAAAVNVSLTFGNTNPETITFTGAGTDNFAFSDLIETDGLTITANNNLTMSSGTGVYSQTYTSTATPMTLTADSMTTGSGISISADALSSGNGIAVDSTSTAFAGKLLNLTASGAANATTRYGAYSSLTGAGTTSTNVAGYFNAQNGATANYALIAENGYVGIGDTTPDARLDIDSAADAAVDSFGVTHTTTTGGANAVEISVTQSDDLDATDTNTGITITATTTSGDADTLLGIDIGNIDGTTYPTPITNAIRIGTGWDSNIVITEDAVSKTKIDLASGAGNAKWIAIDSGWALSFVNDSGFKFYHSGGAGKAFGSNVMNIDDNSIDAYVDIFCGTAGTNRWLKMRGNILFEESDDYIGTYSAGTITLGNIQNTTTASTFQFGRTSGIDIFNFDVTGATYNFATLKATGDITLSPTGNDVLPDDAGGVNLGDATYYWNDVSYKTLTDRGCLGWFDKGVELQDGKIVSDIEALKSIQPHPTKLTVYGVPMLDYQTMPKVVYKPATKDGVILPRNENGEPYLETEENGQKIIKPSQDGAEISALLSIMIGAIKELDAQNQALREKVAELESRI